MDDEHGSDPSSEEDDDALALHATVDHDHEAFRAARQNRAVPTPSTGRLGDTGGDASARSSPRSKRMSAGASVLHTLRAIKSETFGLCNLDFSAKTEAKAGGTDQTDQTEQRGTRGSKADGASSGLDTGLIDFSLPPEQVQNVSSSASSARKPSISSKASSASAIVSNSRAWSREAASARSRFRCHTSGLAHFDKVGGF